MHFPYLTYYSNNFTTYRSVRPGIEKLFVNVDASSGLMYKTGALIDVALEYLGQTEVDALDERNLSDSDRMALNQFLRGVRVYYSTSPLVPAVTRTIRQVLGTSADRTMFRLRDGSSTTVGAYFTETTGKPVPFPRLVCIQVL